MQGSEFGRRHVELRTVADVGSDEAVLLLGRRVGVCVALPCSVWVVVVVAPLGEVVGEFEAGRVCTRILKVDDYELLVRVRWQQQRRCPRGQQPQNVAVLGLVMD